GPPPRLPREHLLAELQALLVLLAADPLPDLVARPGGLHVGQPVAGRLGLRTSHHLHRVAVFQRAVQRRDAAVDAGALTVLADFRMHRKREVYWGRAIRQTVTARAGP